MTGDHCLCEPLLIEIYVRTTFYKLESSVLVHVDAFTLPSFKFNVFHPKVLYKYVSVNNTTLTMYDFFIYKIICSVID